MMVFGDAVGVDEDETYQIGFAVETHCASHNQASSIFAVLLMY